MGYQFIHENAYSVQLTAGSKKENSNTVEKILAEANRVVGSCNHVEKPLPPIPIFGNFNKITEKCQEWLDNTKDSTGKKVRKDSCVLLAGVVSIGAEDNYKWEEIREASLKYLIEKFGEDRLVSVVEHVDEPFKEEPHKGIIHHHFHYYVVPKPGEAFENIHEGKKAVAQVKKNWLEKVKEYSQKPETIPEQIIEKLGNLQKGKLSKEEIKTASPEVLVKALKSISNANAEMIFYKAAMKKFQDDYYANVGVKMGLTRDGPRRGRLTSAENNARKEEAKLIADTIIQVKTNAYEEAKKIGYEQGLINGRLSGYDKGYAQGEINAKNEQQKAFSDAIEQGLKAGEKKALSKAKKLAKDMYQKDLAEKPMSKLGSFMAGVKYAMVENPYIKKLQEQFKKQLNEVNDKLDKALKDLEKEKTNANNRVSKIANELTNSKAINEGLKKELDKELENSKYKQTVIYEYQKMTGLTPDKVVNLTMPKK